MANHDARKRGGASRQGALAVFLSLVLGAQVACAGLRSDRHSAVENWRPPPSALLLSGGEWRAVYLDGEPRGGRFAAQGSEVTLGLDRPQGAYAVCNPRPISGHFYAEVAFDRDASAGLCLLRDRDGKPDPANYTSINVATEADGKVTVSVHDRQNGSDDVLDCQAKSPGEPNWWRKRYSIALDDQFSVGVTRTDGRFRIFRDAASGMLRFYVGIRKQIQKEWCAGWIELSPSPDWSAGSGRFYVGVCVRSGEAASASARFRDLRAVRVPTEDRDDRGAGFAVTRRDCNWSGFLGEALVVTFGPECPFARDGRKFLFWSQANYLPLWLMDNQYCPAFGNNETWGGEAVSGACFEPMSDRLLRYSSVEVVEDNAVRKSILWHYAQIDPDYVPYGWRQGGTQLPYSDELWTFYPDGTVIRRDRYYPCLDTDQPPHPLGVKLFQADVVFGSRSVPADYLDPQCLSVLSVAGDLVQLAWPGREGDFRPPRDWKAVIAAVHSCKPGMPDTFNAYAQDEAVPETFANPPMDLLSTWHRSHWWRFSHWPCDKEPYMWASNSQIEGRGQVTHCSLFHIGANRDLGWQESFKVDPANGRKYREWVSLHGLVPRRAYAEMRRRTASWLYGGKVKVTDEGCKFVGRDVARMELCFEALTPRASCRFILSPAPGTPAVLHPVVRVNGWGDRPIRVRLDGRLLAQDADYRACVEGGAALVWLNEAVEKPGALAVE